MNVIYKYEVKYDDSGKSAHIEAPKNLHIIRYDYVYLDDDNYGYFCWGIINPDDTGPIIKINVPTKTPFPFRDPYSSYTSNTFLRIKEKQTILACNGEYPAFVEEKDGLMFIYFKKSIDNRDNKLYNIFMLKTGQKIDEDLFSANYLGMLKIFIGQELGLYVFAKETQL